MKQELFKAFHTAFSRAKKSGTDYFVVPDKYNVFIFQHPYSLKGDELFYIVKNTGVIIKYDSDMIFNLGTIDNMLASDYP
jgi:hypothetical protein